MSRQILVNGAWWRIEEGETGEAYGLTDYDLKMILIKPGLGEREYARTLAHELIHAFSSDLSESCVQGIENLLADAGLL